MCDAIEYVYNGERLFATARADGSHLPVRMRSGAVFMVPWGAQGRRFYGARETRVVWSEEPWVPLSTIKSGAWADAAPRPVCLAVTRFMVARRLDIATLDHWTTLRPGEYLQGALLRQHGESAVYIVTVEPPAHLSVLSPWPRIVTAGNKSWLDPRR